MPPSFAFRLLTKDSIPDAIKKSERYRLLGEPDEAESVCLDILQVDPDNQEARVDLILAITDQFGRERRPRVDLATKIVGELTDEYQRRYYEAVVAEREARAHLDLETPPVLVFLRYCEAMDKFAAAAAIRPVGDDSAVIRWNACVRAIRRRQLQPGLEAEEFVEAWARQGQ
ncbi:MAG TPA: hypothetical protein VGP90_13555 [Acidimicrobiia bacterium]|nr:hypothetical protein [Acidimicrobiia bacterium]